MNAYTASNGRPNTCEASSAPTPAAEMQTTTIDSSRIDRGSVGAAISTRKPPTTPAAARTANQ